MRRADNNSRARESEYSRSLKYRYPSVLSEHNLRRPNENMLEGTVGLLYESEPVVDRMLFLFFLLPVFASGGRCPEEGSTKLPRSFEISLPT